MMNYEPSALKEVHKIRLKNYEATKELSPEERNRLRKERSKAIVEKYGFKVVSVSVSKREYS